MSNPFRYFNSSPEVIRLVVMMYVRYPLSLRNVEDLNSAQFMLRSTTISTRNVISSPAKSTNKDARPRSASGARSLPDSRLGLGKLCHTQTTSRCSDKASVIPSQRNAGPDG